MATLATSEGRPGWKFWAAFGSLAVNNLAAALDATTLSVALPIITADLHGTSIQAFWAGTIFPLTATVLMLEWVSLSDAFGRKHVLVVVLLLFAVGSILCAISHSFSLFLAGRAIQGAGSGGLMTMTTVIVTDLVPLRQRGKFIAMISSVWALGTVIGPIFGGTLAQAGSWRWIFWLNLPIIGIGLVGIVLFLSLASRERLLLQKLAEIDYFGSFLFIASTTSVLLPLIWGGVSFEWSSWHTLVPLILGVFGLAAFCIFESRAKRARLVPMSLFSNRSTSIVYAGAFAHGLILYAFAYYLPEYFQGSERYSPTISGVATLPQTLTIVPSSIIVGITVGVTGRYRWAVWLGWALTTLGCGLLILLDVQTSIPAWIFLVMVSGLGVGILFPSVSLAAQASSDPAVVAIAASFAVFFRSFGQAVGIAIGGSIFENRLEAQLKHVSGLNGPTTAQNAVAFISRLRDLPAGSAIAVVLQQAFANSFRTIWIVMCGIAGFIFLLSLFVKEYSMDQEHITEQGFKTEGARSNQ